MDFSFLPAGRVNAGPAAVAGFDGAFAGASSCHLAPDNFYSLREKFAFESIGCIVSEDFIFSTKYHRILLKEWMNFCMVGGYIVIIFAEDHKRGKTKDLLLDELFLLFGNDIEVDWATESGKKIFVIKKLKPVLSEGDSIDKWSFGLITRGDKDEQADRVIDSILEQKIPHFEIIVCGKYAGRHLKKVKYVEFTLKDEKGWISKKKNIILGHAKHENVMVIHDRILLGREWHEGMKKYGNYFDVLSCPQILLGSEDRKGDWTTIGPGGIVGNLEYSDWDSGITLDGALYIMKKKVWEKAKWNEHRFWNQGEDWAISKLFHREGFVPRFNPYSKCFTTIWRWGNYPTYEKNPQKLGRIRASLMGRIAPHGRGLFYKASAALPFLSGLGKKFGVSKLDFVCMQKPSEITEGGDVKDSGGKAILKKASLTQKSNEMAYFTAENSSGERKRFKALVVDGKTLVYRDY